MYLFKISGRDSGSTNESKDLFCRISPSNGLPKPFGRAFPTKCLILSIVPQLPGAPAWPNTPKLSEKTSAECPKIITKHPRQVNLTFQGPVSLYSVILTGQLWQTSQFFFIFNAYNGESKTSQTSCNII